MYYKKQNSHKQNDTIKVRKTINKIPRVNVLHLLQESGRGVDQSTEWHYPSKDKWQLAGTGAGWTVKEECRGVGPGGGQWP